MQSQLQSSSRAAGFPHSDPHLGSTSPSQRASEQHGCPGCYGDGSSRKFQVKHSQSLQNFRQLWLPGVAQKGGYRAGVSRPEVSGRSACRGNLKEHLAERQAEKDTWWY